MMWWAPEQADVTPRLDEPWEGYVERLREELDHLAAVVPARCDEDAWEIAAEVAFLLEDQPRRREIDLEIDLWRENYFARDGEDDDHDDPWQYV